MSSTSPNWRREIRAIFLKEWRSEARTRSGLLSGGLYAFVSVVALSLAAYGRALDGSLEAGLLWTGWLFSAAIIGPRLFLAEEELRTGDLLRQWSNPYSVFWGKFLFNVATLLGANAAIAVLLIMLLSIPVPVVWLVLASWLGGTLCLASVTTLCGAFASRATNRAMLAAAISAPLLLPVAALGVTSLRVGFGDGVYLGGASGAAGLFGYAAATLAIGPRIYAAMWKA